MSSPDSSEALSVKRVPQGRGLGCLFVVFFLVGSVALWYFAGHPLMGMYSARNWVETPCTIVSSKVESSDGGDGETYRIKIEYDYVVGAQTFRSDRYNFMGSGFYSAGHDGKQKVVDRYPPKSKAVCYVDPELPSSAVLNRSLTPDMWWGLIGLPFFAIGAGGLLYRAGVFGSRSPDMQSASGAEGDLEPSADGSVVLKPETTPLMAFGVGLLIALFWNGIVSFFVYDAITSWQGGLGSWMNLFLLPFVIVGIGLIAFVGHSFFALFNARPTLTLSRSSIPLGGRATVSWEFSGNTGAIQTLKIALEGKESATYRRGTKSHTDHATFHKTVLFETHEPLDIAAGKTDVEVPGNLMHTFASNNNKVAWALSLCGEIPLRPDVNATFPVTVTPHEQAAD